MHYSWPGNVRQLENAVDRAITLSGSRMELAPEDFPFSTAGVSTNNANVPATPLDSHSSEILSEAELPEIGIDFETTVNRLERMLIDQALRRAHGNKKQAADILGLKRTTLTAKLKSLEAAAS